MDEETFNLQLRKFLKKVGVSSQSAIENAVREALAAGRIGEDEVLKARMVLTIEAVGLEHEVEGEIALN